MRANTIYAFKNVPSLDVILKLQQYHVGVRHLTFARDFNQPIPVGVIPPNIEYLTFGAYFNQSILVGVIPPNVQHLIFGFCFNRPITAGAIH